MNQTSWSRNVKIGNTDTNINYWGQYDRLISFIFKSFPENSNRFEKIAIPLLHLISHSLELGYKENIEYLQKYSKCSKPRQYKNWSKLFKDHRLINLHKEFKNQFVYLCEQLKIDKEIFSEFNTYCESANVLVDKLNTETETYRYAYKLNIHGKKIKRIIKHETIIDLIEVAELFEKTKILLTYTIDIISCWTDYQDFIKKHPNYSKGIGYLKIPKCSRLGGQLDSEIYLKLDELYERKSDNLWYDSDLNEFLEVQIDGDELYVIAIKNEE